MITSIRGGQMPAPSSIKRRSQPNFKGNVVESQSPRDEQQRITTEQILGLGVGVAIGLVLIGLIEFARSKKKNLKVVEKVKLTPQQQQVVDLNERLQKDFLLITLKKYNPRWEMVKVVPNVPAPFETKNDFQLYEMKKLVPQLLGREAQLELYVDTKNVPTEKEIFVEYLKLRSEYYDKENEFDVVRSEALKNPSEDVVDAETLRLYILANNTRQFLYFDDSVEEPHYMLFFVDPLLRANCAAKILEEFKPQKEQKDMTENEKKYFDYMNKLGKFWHEHLKKEASEKLSKYAKIITGEVEAPKCYTKGEEERHDRRRIFKPDGYLNRFGLLDMLTHKATEKWNDVMKKEETETIEYNGKTRRHILSSSLEDKIGNLRTAFMNLKEAVAKNNTSLKSKSEKSINILTEQVLI